MLLRIWQPGFKCETKINGMQAERVAREKEEEDEFRRQTMERFAEQDRLEQMNAQKRRIKVAQHAREVERLIQEKRAMFEAAMVGALSLVKVFARDCYARTNAAHATITIDPPSLASCNFPVP